MIGLTNSDCEALISGKWRLISVELLHGHDEVIRRCPECHSAIKLMKQGRNGQKAHFEHHKRNPDCSLGDAKGKDIPYTHITVEVSEINRQYSYNFADLLRFCLETIEVISNRYMEDDIIQISESPLSDSEKKLEINARIGQGQFRKDVIKVWGSETCALTLTPVKEILIASHIKAWRNCQNTSERLDGANGILLCAHIDKLFDKHRITFKNVAREFKLVLASDLDRALMSQLGINEGDVLATGRLQSSDLDKFKGYLAHHQKIFCQLNNIKTL